MKKPAMKSFQFAVGHSNISSGHVLKTDRTVFLGEGEVFLIFDTEREANDYMQDRVSREPEIECWVEDSSGRHIRTLNKNGERK